MAHAELKLNSKWAPHQGHNEAYVDLRSELVLVAKSAGLAFLLTAEGAVPPSFERIKTRRKGAAVAKGEQASWKREAQDLQAFGTRPLKHRADVQERAFGCHGGTAATGEAAVIRRG